MLSAASFARYRHSPYGWLRVTPLQAARAAYLWRLHADRGELENRLADLEVVFRWLLQVQAGEQTADLLRARATYVAELAGAGLRFDAEIADLAAVHQELISAELHQAAAQSLVHAANPSRSGCNPYRAFRGGSD